MLIQITAKATVQQSPCARPLSVNRDVPCRKIGCTLIDCPPNSREFVTYTLGNGVQSFTMDIRISQYAQIRQPTHHVLPRIVTELCGRIKARSKETERWRVARWRRHRRQLEGWFFPSAWPILHRPQHQRYLLPR